MGSFFPPAAYTGLAVGLFRAFAAPLLTVACLPVVNRSRAASSLPSSPASLLEGSSQLELHHVTLSVDVVHGKTLSLDTAPV